MATSFRATESEDEVYFGRKIIIRRTHEINYRAHVLSELRDMGVRIERSLAFILPFQRLFLVFPILDARRWLGTVRVY
jgi:hypothetical protein